MPRKSNLSLVTPNDVAEAAIMSTDAPPVTVPAVSPLSEYRADAMRRKLDAEAEIALLAEQQRRADEALADRIRASAEKHQRFVDFETQKHDAERREIDAHLEQYRRIVDGADAALAASDAADADVPEAKWQEG